MFSRSLSSKALRPLLGRYTVIPYDIFRVQSGSQVALRDFQVQKRLGRRSYDLHVGPGGMVQPSIGDKLQGPNGCSVRPKGLNLDEIVDNFPGSDILIYRLEEGIQLPDDLVLLHEHTDHHALQCATPMTLKSLNQKLTDLFATRAECMSREDYFARYGSV
ncbi:hypothetical protein BJ322DRAFT_1059391 [Thelephora terrestris]|uniref:Tse2 ADP-ribosyltransferase toxin domain-containing protein n=1 Tax=Thelephora terrestris TaxID=56493 RepID=A0A9P6L7V0_9AGAM|nr:hypothetical protein BJ322DRAFT_1059391 [Thelephora terrestris]